jgi:sugar-specific transcriptional regulator TrmB
MGKYEHLEIMHTKGVLYLVPTKPMKYCAVHPREVIASVKSRFTHQFSSLETFVQSTLEPLYNIQKTPVQNSHFLVLSGRSSLHTRLVQGIEGSNTFIRILTTSNGLKRLVALREPLSQAQRRGVTIQLLAPLTIENQEDAALMESFAPKHVENISTTVALFDSQACYVIDPQPDNENYKSGKDVAIYTENACFLSLIHMLFSQLMHRSLPIVANTTSFAKENTILKGNSL